MSKLSFSWNKPGLLVSVRNAAEAVTALAGGADVIDVKEPDRGSLGAADGATISAVVDAVNGRALVTAAVGELIDLLGANNGDGLHHIPAGVSLFKIGLAGCASLANWQTSWKRVVDVVASSSCGTRPVAVAYADWRTARSPNPREILSAAIEVGCPALLVDTWNKSAGSLFDHWPLGDLQGFLKEVHSHHLVVVLAGSLVGSAILDAARLMPDLVAVRTAACEAGRGGTVSLERVRELKQAIATATRKVATV